MLSFENQNIEFKQAYVPDIRKEVMALPMQRAERFTSAFARTGRLLGWTTPTA